MRSLLACSLFAALPAVGFAAGEPKLVDVAPAIRAAIDAKEISGAVTAVVTKDKLVDLEALGLADVATQRPMQPDTVFWIKSMTKPMTAVGLLMLQDEGKVSVEDPVAKYLPEFAGLKTPSGKPANLTIAQLLTHTSGLGEGLGEAGSREDPARTLAELVRQAVASPMQFEPGTRWKYCQSGINTVGRIIEVVSGLSYDEFISRRLFAPLGMTSTSFYPDEKLQSRLVTRYAKASATGELTPVDRPANLATRDHPPLPSSGLWSTASDIARFCQMLLRGGELDGRRILRPDTVQLLAAPRTGDLAAGFVPGSAWGLGCGVVTAPQGVTASLSRGSYGHGGAFGTQMWIDPRRGVAYILMIQREGFGTPGYRNADDTKVRGDFQRAAADDLPSRTVNI